MHTYTRTMEHFSAIPSVTTWMDVEDFMLSEVSHLQKDRY